MGPIGRMGHRPALDGVRGVAVVAVVLGHASALVVPSTRPWIAPAGYLGVDLFFVLSGFLITTLLLEERRETGRLSPLGFYGRRAARLLPALLVLLTVHVGYAIATDIGAARELRTVGLVLGYVFNWAVAAGWEIAPDLDFLWTLSVEEQFYVVWPWAVLGLAALRPRQAAVLIVAGVAVSATLRWIVTEAATTSAYHRTDTRADALLVGALAAVVRGELTDRHRRWLARLAPVAAALFVAAVLMPDRIGPSYDARVEVLLHGGFTAVALAAAVVILAAVDDAWDARGALRNRVLTGLGRVSYGLYLWHGFLAYVALRHLQGLWAPARLVLWVAATAAATAASWHWVEQPVLRWWRRRATHDGGASLVVTGRVVAGPTTPRTPLRR